MSPRSKMDHRLPWPPTLTSPRPSPVTPATCLWPGSWGRLRAQAWSAFPRGQLASLKLCFFLLLRPGAPGAGGVSLGMSPGQYGPGVSSQQRASWAQQPTQRLASQTETSVWGAESPACLPPLPGLWPPRRVCPVPAGAPQPSFLWPLLLGSAACPPAPRHAESLCPCRCRLRPGGGEPLSRAA